VVCYPADPPIHLAPKRWNHRFIMDLYRIALAVVCSICYLFMYCLGLKTRKTVVNRILRSPRIKPGRESDGSYSIPKMRILLVVAHPDDECYFFGPILNCLGPRGNSNGLLHILCMSIGNYEQLGETRHKEFEGSCRTFGIPSNRLTTLNHP
jgi:hypothetical protein